MRNYDNTVKAAVSVSQMAEMVGISRSRFYQLIDEGIFLPPVYDIKTRRPFFPPQIQNANLEIRSSNCGANSKPILFYARRSAKTPDQTKQQKLKRNSQPKEKDIVDKKLIEDLKSLGLDGINHQQVLSALRVCFPEGTSRIDESEVVRKLYRHLKRQNRSDNVGR